MKTGNFEGVEKKDFFGNVETPFRIINKKGITPGDAELEINKRARSARLRIAEKI
jgi:16S rRNA (cytosine1402-N4)-methyltransferase